MNFSNKTVIVTGASAGIGRATAIKFAKEGARVAIVDINGEALEQVRAEVLEFTSDVRAYVCDVSDEEKVHEVCALAASELGPIDILINNAGIWRGSEYFVNVPSSEWKKYININILGVMYFAQAVLPSMLERGYGRIINIGSVAGVYGNAKMAHYSMTKGAVIAFTKALAKEVSENGVTVNCISPGSVSGSSDPDYTATTPSQLSFTGRTGSHMENANLICFIASDDAAYISGQNIQIDGCRKKM